jgi:hypothetical protein
MAAPGAVAVRSSLNPYLVGAIAWLVPGAGHLVLGRPQKAVTFLVALTLMFANGLWLEGRLFPFDFTQPLVALMALAAWGIGAPHLVAQLLGTGAGRVVAITYEYGNTFIIAAGLLNMLVVLDVFDIAKGRK